MSGLTKKMIEVNNILGTPDQRWVRKQIKGEIFFVHPVGIVISRKTLKLFKWSEALEEFQFCTEIFQEFYGRDKCKLNLDIDEIKRIISVDSLKKMEWFESLDKLNTLIEFQVYLNLKFSVPLSISRPHLNSLEEMRLMVLKSIFNNESPSNQMKFLIMDTYIDGINRYRRNENGDTQFEEFLEYRDLKTFN